MESETGRRGALKGDGPSAAENLAYMRIDRVDRFTTPKEPT